MSRNLVSTTLVIHACPNALIGSVAKILPESEAKWLSQDLLVGTVCTEISLKLTFGQFEELASALLQIPGLYLDLLQQGRESGTWFMLAPGLGLFRAQINAAGEIMVSEDRIRMALDQSAGNHRELSRLLRLALGQAWDDILEPFRAARYQSNLAIINQAV